MMDFYILKAVWIKNIKKSLAEAETGIWTKIYLLAQEYKN